jgi:hypothetical protein
MRVELLITSESYTWKLYGKVDNILASFTMTREGPGHYKSTTIQTGGTG